MENLVRWVLMINKHSEAKIRQVDAIRLDALRTLRTAMEFHEHWKESMPERLRMIADEAIKQEDRMIDVDGSP